ncbi:LysE family translocator [Vibrio renipiscarius]|uniref:Amino acid transporter LysE n=1 Tax=Vibrio renipiscarius TaxID=1461322 RepID=A0A0C2NNR1_9VIBR|nr:LysE family translocator [Vibrio renipiscarius]KII76559.1 amino acid transporter LysE [Vibrio renipiscarius]KII77920.1 amino acid transporter LysE [Vibrio renipiscarius]
MPWEQLTALALFAFVSTFTPGPNNIMLMTSGANVGFNKSIPHMLGITIGFPAMVILVGFGLIAIFDQYPMIHHGLKVISLIYLAYLAWQIARSQPPKEKNTHYKPLSFWQAACFQWVNPKGWSMALTAVSVYNPSNSGLGLVIIALVYALANVPSVSFWTLAGQKLQQLLTSRLRVRSFNYSMALLLIASTLPML